MPSTGVSEASFQLYTPSPGHTPRWTHGGEPSLPFRRHGRRARFHIAQAVGKLAAKSRRSAIALRAARGATSSFILRRKIWIFQVFPERNHYKCAPPSLLRCSLPLRRTSNFTERVHPLFSFQLEVQSQPYRNIAIHELSPRGALKPTTSNLTVLDMQIAAHAHAYYDNYVIVL